MLQCFNQFQSTQYSNHQDSTKMVSSACPDSLSPIGAELTPYYNNKSANGRMELIILSQPEEQHRARYLTEGSRGAIKDVSGLGHPIVKLTGYHSRQPIKLECYIGHDKHDGLPHLFYQASRISGKNSTQCMAHKFKGTSLIVMNLLPENGMQATIDCVGILKERNVDVEQKLTNLNHLSKTVEFSSDANFPTSPFSAISQQRVQPQQQQPQQQTLFSQQTVPTTTPQTPINLPQSQLLHSHVHQPATLPPPQQVPQLQLHSSGLYQNQNHNHHQATVMHEALTFQNHTCSVMVLDARSNHRMARSITGIVS